VPTLLLYQNREMWLRLTRAKEARDEMGCKLDTGVPRAGEALALSGMGTAGVA
jgi:hypothetical protein